MLLEKRKFSQYFCVVMCTVICLSFCLKVASFVALLPVLAACHTFLFVVSINQSIYLANCATTEMNVNKTM